MDALMEQRALGQTATEVHHGVQATCQRVEAMRQLNLEVETSAKGAEQAVSEAHTEIKQLVDQMRTTLTNVQQVAQEIPAAGQSNNNSDQATGTTTANQNAQQADLRRLAGRVAACEASVALVRGCGCPPNRAAAEELEQLKVRLTTLQNKV